MMPLQPATVLHGNPAPERSAAPPATMPAAPGWALFLDLDGTLCGYEPHPDRVVLDTAQRDVLRRLALRTDGALCVLSGRAGADLDQVLGGLPLERRGDHGHDAAAMTDAISHALAAAAGALAALATEHPGTWIERKPAGCALHYRAVPHSAERLTGAVRLLAEGWPELRLLAGQCVLELIPARASKGAALRALMARAPFAGRIPIAVGDDVTDEDAFAAAAALGGFGVAVGPRPSATASYRLADTAALNAWLHGLAFPAPERADA